ncbi:MAG: hypothetical protein ACRDZY_21940, partial [Acidimicrobiales bacterium]
MTEPAPDTDEPAPDSAAPEPEAAQVPQTAEAATTPDGAEPGGTAPGTTPSDDQEDIGSAQDKAADPEKAENWRLFARHMETATASMFGSAAGGFGSPGGTANFFLGATNVGQVGDRHGGQTRPLDLKVRSGVVPVAVLERIEQSYVEPDGYPRLKETLAREL